MAIVRILKDIYQGWKIGDEVEVFDEQLENMIDDDGAEIIVPDEPKVEEIVVPIIENKEVVIEPKKVKKVKKVKK